MPAEPTFNSPGFCLASAINSFTEPTGSEAVTASTLGPLPSIATGVNHFGESGGSWPSAMFIA